MHSSLRTLLIALAALLAPAAPAWSATGLTSLTHHAGGPAGSMRVSGGWEHTVDRTDGGLVAGYERLPELPGSVPVRVPHTGDPDNVLPDGQVAWYATTITPGAGRYRLRFGNVNYRATVWVDGEEVRDHLGGWVTFDTAAFTATSAPVRVVVRVDNRRDSIDGLGGVRQAMLWWNWGGLLRDVELRPVGQVDVPTVRVTTGEVGERRAVLRVAVPGQSTTGQQAARPLELRVAGTSRGVRVLNAPAEGEATAVWRVRVPRRMLWSPEHPRRMRLTVHDVASGRPLWEGRVAARQLRTRRGHMELNGRRIRFAGVALHDHGPGTGAALDAAQTDEVVRQVRALGVNLVRAHYVPDARMLDALDRAGIMLWAEAPTSFALGRELARPEVARHADQLVEESVDMVSWRPSAVVVAVGNEQDLQQPLTRSLLRWQAAAVRRINRMLPGVPVAYGSEARAVDDLAAFCRTGIDLLGVNYYLGWYSGARADAGPRFRREGLATVRTWRERCGKPVVLSEFGAEGGVGGRGAQAGTRRYQTILHRQMLQIARRSTAVLEGAIVWALRDFAVRPGWTGGNPTPETQAAPINQKGLVDLQGRRKPAFALVRRQLELLRAGR